MIDKRRSHLVSALIRGDKDQALSLLIESMEEKRIVLESEISGLIVSKIHGAGKNEQDSDI